MIYAKRLPVLILMLAVACENEPLPPDDTPERTKPPPPYDGPHLRVELVEALPPGPLPQGRESGLTGPHERTRRVILSPELAELDRELSAVLDAVVLRIHARGLTLRDLEPFAGDAEAERDLLGMTTDEYLAVHNQIADILTRAQRLMPNPPKGPLTPLQQDSRGGGEQICITDTTVEELEDGTIVITDHISRTCEQIFTGPDPDWTSEEPEPGGGSKPAPMPTFEHDCMIVGGYIARNKCMCPNTTGCIRAVLGTALAETACAIRPATCFIVLYEIANVYWECRQRPCDGVNKAHGR